MEIGKFHLRSRSELRWTRRSLRRRRARSFERCSQAGVSKANPVSCAARLACFDDVGSVPVAFVTDGMQVTVPLSLLGNDDVRLNFQMNAYVLVAPSTTVLFDFMPNSNVPPGRVQ